MSMAKNGNKQGVIINRDATAAQRASQAVQLRASRLTYEQIAWQCGYANPGACRNAVMRELQRTVTPGINNLRLEELSMLDQLHAAVWPLAVAGYSEDQDDDEEEQESGRHKKKRTTTEVNLFAVDRILAIAKRRSELLGLDTPVKVADHKNIVVIREVPMGLLPPVEAGS
jgi:hypothetical protein